VLPCVDSGDSVHGILIAVARAFEQVYFSSSAQMADLIEDISRDLDSGRFDILPSHEAISSPTLTSTSGSITPREAKPVVPLGSRLQALLTQHLGTATPV